jgi:hypothetical protein
LTPNRLTEFSGFSGKSIDILDYQDVEEQGLTTNSDRIFNLILSARLIRVLDFIFAETTPVGAAPWPAPCCRDWAESFDELSSRIKDTPKCSLLKPSWQIGNSRSTN